MTARLKHTETRIMTAAFIAVNIGIAKLLEAVTCKSLLGCACLVGTGFTMPLFVALSSVLFPPESSVR